MAVQEPAYVGVRLVFAAVHSHCRVSYQSVTQEQQSVEYEYYANHAYYRAACH